jgi:hypothetical protein
VSSRRSPIIAVAQSHNLAVESKRAKDLIWWREAGPTSLLLILVIVESNCIVLCCRLWSSLDFDVGVLYGDIYGGIHWSLVVFLSRTPHAKSGDQASYRCEAAEPHQSEHQVVPEPYPVYTIRISSYSGRQSDKD